MSYVTYVIYYYLSYYNAVLTAVRILTRWGAVCKAVQAEAVPTGLKSVAVQREAYLQKNSS